MRTWSGGLSIVAGMVMNEPQSKSIDVEYVCADAIVHSVPLPYWREPDMDTLTFGDVTYEVAGYDGPYTRENGRTLYQIRLTRL